MNRVWSRWSQVQSKHNLPLHSIVYHSLAYLYFSGLDPTQPQSKECFVFDVNRSRNMFNLPATVPYSVAKDHILGKDPEKRVGKKMTY